MEILIIFLFLCLLEYGFYYWKKSKVNDYQEIVLGVADITTLNNKDAYKRSVIFLSNMLNMFKRFLWPMVIIILFINFIISLILGGIIHFIISLF